MNTSFCKESFIEEMINYIESRVDGFSKELHLDTSFSRLGLDSAGHVQLTTVIEDFMQMEIAPTLAFDYPTINAMAEHLTEKLNKQLAQAAN
jgi:acyl carrier protein